MPRILLDEDVPTGLRHLVPGHDVRTVPDIEWAGMANGRRLVAAEANGFDIFITDDRNSHTSKPLLAVGWPSSFCPKSIGRQSASTRILFVRPSKGQGKEPTSKWCFLVRPSAAAPHQIAVETSPVDGASCDACSQVHGAFGDTRRGVLRWARNARSMA